MCKPTRGSEALSTSSLTWCGDKGGGQSLHYFPPLTLSLFYVDAVMFGKFEAMKTSSLYTHIIFSKVTLPLSVGLHNHVWGFCLADSYEAGRHSW